MRRALGLALALAAGVAGCMPRGETPPDVRSLRGQLHKKTITIPVWTQEVAEELAAHPNDYAGKKLAIQAAHMDPRVGFRLDKDICQFALSGGGSVTMPAEAMPAPLRGWTGLPLKLQAAVRRLPTPTETPEADGPALRARSLDLAHPLELADIQVDYVRDGTWLAIQVENYGNEGARATLEVRFGDLHERRRLPAVAPGEATSFRLKLSPSATPAWGDLPAERRSLRLLFDDGSETRVDLSKWLEGPPDTLLDWGYTFTPPGNAVMMLSAEEPEAELERFAALELRSYLAQFSDANIEPREPEVEDALPALPLLVVGTAKHNKLAAELVREAGLEPRLNGLGDEGYLVKSLRHCGRPALLVTALTPRGLVHGVYALLEHYGVRFTMTGVRLPAREAFRVPDVDEARVPLFARRTLVAAGPEPAWTARWSQWQWVSMIDLAAKNRFNEVVFPLDGLEGTFAYEPKRSQAAMFPFEIGPYTCMAEAYLAHQRGLAILADYARRRGIELSFARRSPDGALRRAAAPACLAAKAPADGIGQPIAVLDDPGDFLGLLRVQETAAAAGALLAAKAGGFAVPYRPGAGARAAFLARFAWDKDLTPEAFYRRMAAMLCEGAAAEKMAKALLESDRLDDEVLAAAPKPFGLGAPLVFPVEEGDLACDWGRLRTRAASGAVAAQIKDLKEQGRKLRELQAHLEPIYTEFLEALGTVTPPWESPLFEAAPASQRSERVSEAIYRFRALLGALASVQEGALAYYAGLTEPAEALPGLAVAAAKYRKARRILLWVMSRSAQSDMGPTLAGLGERLGEQAGLLAEWLGPAAEAEPGARLTRRRSDAVVYLFRSRNEDIFAAYKLRGDEVVQLRLSTAEARVFRRGQATTTQRAEGGLFLVSLGTVPTYVVARRAAWPGQPSP